MAISELPLCSGLRAARVFVEFGWEIRSEGNHIILTKRGSRLHISIPNHREVDRRLLHAEIRKARLTDKKFRQMYNEIF
jgi:hypothetical protein